MRFPKIREEWVVGAVVGVISGYYIFNDLLRNIADKKTNPKLKIEQEKK